MGTLPGTDRWEVDEVDPDECAVGGKAAGAEVGGDRP